MPRTRRRTKVDVEQTRVRSAYKVAEDLVRDIEADILFYSVKFITTEDEVPRENYYYKLFDMVQELVKQREKLADLHRDLNPTED